MKTKFGYLFFGYAAGVMTMLSYAVPKLHDSWVPTAFSALLTGIAGYLIIRRGNQRNQ